MLKVQNYVNDIKHLQMLYLKFSRTKISVKLRLWAVSSVENFPTFRKKMQSGLYPISSFIPWDYSKAAVDYKLTESMEHSPPWEANTRSLLGYLRNSPSFVLQEGSLPCFTLGRHRSLSWSTWIQLDTP